jgi:hypothetical protein
MKITRAEGLSGSYAVFTGEVTKIEPNATTNFGGKEITLAVRKVWKGDIGAQVQVRTAGSSAACGYNFVKGQAYLVYADRDEADPMRVSLCSRTAPVASAQKDLDFLGKPSHELDSNPRRKSRRGGDNCSASPGPVGHTGLGWVLLFVAGGTLALRRIV